MNHGEILALWILAGYALTGQFLAIYLIKEEIRNPTYLTQEGKIDTLPLTAGPGLVWWVVLMPLLVNIRVPDNGIISAEMIIVILAWIVGCVILVDKLTQYICKKLFKDSKFAPYFECNGNK